MPSIAEQFPNVAAWVQDGWIEIGPTEWSSSFIRVLDIGGMIFEGDDRYDSIEDALAAAEKAIEAW